MAPRGKRISVRVSESEHAAITSKARAAGYSSTGDYLRTLAQSQSPYVELDTRLSAVEKALTVMREEE